MKIPLQLENQSLGEISGHLGRNFHFLRIVKQISDPHVVGVDVGGARCEVGGDVDERDGNLGNERTENARYRSVGLRLIAVGRWHGGGSRTWGP